MSIDPWRALGYPVESPEHPGVDEDGRAVWPPPWAPREACYPVESPEHPGVDEDGRAVWPPPWAPREA